MVKNRAHKEMHGAKWQNGDFKSAKRNEKEGTENEKKIYKKMSPMIRFRDFVVEQPDFMFCLTVTKVIQPYSDSVYFYS